MSDFEKKKRIRKWPRKDFSGYLSPAHKVFAPFVRILMACISLESFSSSKKIGRKWNCWINQYFRYYDCLECYTLLRYFSVNYHHSFHILQDNFEKGLTEKQCAAQKRLSRYTYLCKVIPPPSNFNKLLSKHFFMQTLAKSYHHSIFLRRF